MNDSKHPRKAVGFRVPVDDDVGGNDADANFRPDFGARRAAIGEARQKVIELFACSIVSGGDAVLCLCVEIGDDFRSVRVRGRRDDDARR